MDDKTLVALTALANKLGTTAEYLWAVLLRQAPINAITDMIVYLFWVIGGVVWTRFVMLQTTAPPRVPGEFCEGAFWKEDAAGFAWISVYVLWFFITLIVSISLPTITAGLFHREYWALKQLLR